MRSETSHVHVDWALFLHDLGNIRRVVIDCHIGANGLQERDLLFRSCARDHLQAILLCELYDRSAVQIPR